MHVYHTAFTRINAEYVILHSIPTGLTHAEKMFIVEKRQVSIHLFDEIIISKYFLSTYLLWYLIGSALLPSGSVFHPVSHRQR